MDHWTVGQIREPGGAQREKRASVICTDYLVEKTLPGATSDLWNRLDW